MGGMGDERMDGGFMWKCTRLAVVGTCAWFILFPAAWGCFGKGAFAGVAGMNPCVGVDGGLFWKLLISVFACTYNMFGMLSPTEKSWYGVSYRNDTSIYRGTVLDANSYTRDEWSDKFGLKMGDGTSKNLGGQLVNNFGMFASALVILYLAKMLLLRLQQDGPGCFKRCCPCFATNVSD